MNIDVEKGIVEAIELKDLKTSEKPGGSSEKMFVFFLFINSVASFAL